MNKLEHVGTFKGVPKNCKLVENGEGLKWVADIAVVEAWNPETKAWDDWSGHDLGITSFETLISAKGEVNKVTVENLRKSIGWDGVTLEKLSGDHDLIKFGTKHATYNGKTSLRVAWMDHPEAEGRMLKPVDATAMKTIQAKFGAKLKAVALTAKK